MSKVQHTLPLKKVKVDDVFWSSRQKLIRESVLPYQYDILNDALPGLEKSHAIENFRIAAGESQGQYYGMVFQDSDVAKWLEAAAYALCGNDDADLRHKTDDLIALIGRAQQEDGYLNTYFILKAPEERWNNLKDWHELYCAGHMIEAAVAYYECLGKEKLLNIVRRLADHICRRFGPGKLRGAPGHEEIELSLIKLYRVTGESRYLEQAQYFLDERGADPDVFVEEYERRKPGESIPKGFRSYAQHHLPVREQSTAIGHSVRAGYLYTAMADIASEIDDPAIVAACHRLWDNIVHKQMYITGGIGSTAKGEAFTVDYDLPNDSVYAETCACISLVFFARRMLELSPRGEYADVIEREIYNGVLSGMQLDGKRFFYVNPLEVIPGESGVLPGLEHVKPQRPSWYRCACCPPNLARLVLSLGEYAWGENVNTIYNHFYLGGDAEFALAGGVHIFCRSEYPWRGYIHYEIQPKQEGVEFSLAIHIPEWCREWSVLINGQLSNVPMLHGYATLCRAWRSGDTVEISFPIVTRRVYSNAAVRASAGCVAIQRGPIVYCVEQADNGTQLWNLSLPKIAAFREKISKATPLTGLTLLETDGLRYSSDDMLYSETPPLYKPITLTFIPYFAWANRSEGEMRVWIREEA